MGESAHDGFLARGLPRGDDPVLADESLDMPSTLRHLDRMIDAGVHGMIMLGTVGENCSLEPAEKLEVLKATPSNTSAARVPVLTGVAEYTTQPGLPVRRATPKAWASTA